VKINRDKFELAKKLLLEGKSQRQVAKLAKLNIMQVNQVAGILNIYSDMDELREKLEEQRGILEAQIQRNADKICFYRNLDQQIQRSSSVKKGLEAEIARARTEVDGLQREKAVLQSQLSPLRSEARRLREDIAEGRQELARLDKLKRTFQSDTTQEAQKYFKSAIWNTWASEIRETNLNNLASWLTFDDLAKIIAIKTGKDRGLSYAMWLAKNMPPETIEALQDAFSRQQAK